MWMRPVELTIMRGEKWRQEKEGERKGRNGEVRRNGLMEKNYLEISP